MRIARIIEYFPPHIGGMERHGLILSQEQAKLGHDVEIFIGVGDVSIFPNTFKAPLGFLSLYSRIRRFWFNIWAYFTVKKHHSKNPYDIIHFHGDFVEAYFGGKLSKKLGIPSVLTIHAGLNKKRLKQKNRKIFDNISKIICVSESIATDLESIGVSENKIRIISSGVYLNEFSKTDGEINDLHNQYSKPIIISVGVLRINKGFSYLTEAFKKIKQKINSVTLLIIGNGPERKNLEVLAAGTKGIYFLGSQSHDNVVKYLKAADIFILASVSTKGDREGTSTSIMEAMAAGLPIVATKIGGNSILIKDGENGFLVEEKNNEVLTQAIIKLWKDKNLRRQMKEKNLKDIKEKDWLLIAKKITDVYFR